ncbi:DUF2079 domain-containing protein [Streptomyces pacificus]|uniref:DUF2079 domain-containing protein n=1 Tax=Streptomyces pacificus TaxID=2705029 RepID=UPI0020B12F06|nr:DUF2079 domain-containing protein [Streptomyces pacificus]
MRGDGFHLLGDHFHPLVAVLAPLYGLWPSPLCLLVAQSALLAVAVVPLARWAVRALGRRAAHVVAFGYGVSWGIASAAAFDFREVALAVPLLAFALAALGRRRWGRAVAWAAPCCWSRRTWGSPWPPWVPMWPGRGRGSWGSPRPRPESSAAPSRSRCCCRPSTPAAGTPTEATSPTGAVRSSPRWPSHRSTRCVRTSRP